MIELIIFGVGFFIGYTIRGIIAVYHQRKKSRPRTIAEFTKKYLKDFENIRIPFDDPLTKELFGNEDE